MHAETRLWRDDSARFASAALPVILASAGMLALAVGGVLQIMPLAFAGMGLAVIGFAVFLIASGMDRADSRRETRRRERRAARAEAARAGFAADTGAAERPRDPRADAAVAALTGQGGAGIWPPLPSQNAAQRPATPTPAAAAEPVAMWSPGSKTVPAGWDEDDLVSFDEVPAVSASAPLVAEGAAHNGLSFVEEVVASTDAPGPSASPAPAPEGTERDFRIWPGSKDMDSWSTFTGERRPSPMRHSEEDLKKAMDERRQQLAGRLPTVGAILANVGLKEQELERLRREATRGKCSRCEAVIWAPRKRPIVLKCPGCGHKAKLY